MAFSLIGSIVTESKKEKGTFVGMRFSEDSVKKIMKFIKDNKVPNPIDKDDLHVTVVYSLNIMDGYEPKGELDPPIEVEPKKISLFGEDKDALVVELKSSKLRKRNREIVDTYKPKQTYTDYKPHFTLSYDCKDFNLNVDLSELGVLELVKEYEEEAIID